MRGFSAHAFFYFLYSSFIFSDDMCVGKNTARIFSVPRSDALKICLHGRSPCFDRTCSDELFDQMLAFDRDGGSLLSTKTFARNLFRLKACRACARRAKELRFLPLWEESSKEAHEGGEECGADAARSPPPCDPPSLRAENIRFRSRRAAAGRRSAPLLMKSTVLK